MKMKVGCDLVSIKKFGKTINKNDKVLDKIFSGHELANSSSTESLSGLFAAKEAVIKALDLKAGDWHKMEIIKSKTGRPEIKLEESNKKIISSDISISHHGDYAMAVAVFLLKKK
jgi:holo-[acyl-carrier protein] synthase